MSESSPDLHLVVGNRLYSSWSLRASILLRAFAIPFRETVIPMYRPDTRERMLAYGPTGKVPVLIDGETTVWESLAIMEHVADRFPERDVWPRDPAARAHARSAASEMHAGFTALRSACPMNLTAMFEPRDRGEGVAADVVWLIELWREARSRFGGGDDFLYGAFGAADAMYAPVVSRLHTYAVTVPDDVRAYMDAVLGHPAFRSWRDDAFEEPWRLRHYEDGETVTRWLHEPPERVT